MVVFDEASSGDHDFFAPKFFASTSTNSAFLNLDVAKPLIFDFHAIWCDAQKLASASENQLRAEDVLKLSRRYRDAIHALKSSIDTNTDSSIYNELFSAEILWSLTDALYFKPLGTSFVLDLISWGNYCFGDTSAAILERVNDNGHKPEEHEFYWNAVILSIIHINLTSASRLLRKHSRFERDGSLQKITLFIESFQNFLEQGISNPSAFSETQKKVHNAIQSGDFKSSEQLTVIAGLLDGRVEHYEKCARLLYDNWFELLPAFVLFSSPGADFENIGRIAQTLYSRLCPKMGFVGHGETLSTDIDRPFFSILLKDLPGLMKAICERDTLWCFPVHLVDLFYRDNPLLIEGLGEHFPSLESYGGAQAEPQRVGRRSRIDENNQPMGEFTAVSLRTALVIDYGKALLQSREFWHIGADYVGAMAGVQISKQFGTEPYIHVELDSTRKAEYIFAQAVKDDYPATKEKVSKWFVKRYLDQECYSEALCWALRSELPELINFVSSKLLSVLNAETISQMRIFDAMAEQFYRYPSLLLLQRFYEFRRSLLQGRASEAATRIHELVTSGMAPIGFQLVLFDQMTRLLDPSSSEFIKTPQLDRDSIYDLMKAVNKFQIQNSVINPLKARKENPAILKLNTKIKFLRQALCTALATRSLN